MIADISAILKRSNPEGIAKEIAKRARQLRLQKNITQQSLAERSGVSLGSVKRFESSGQISLQNLLLYAVVLDATDEFGQLFLQIEYKSVDEVIKINKSHTRKRARNTHD